MTAQMIGTATSAAAVDEPDTIFMDARSAVDVATAQIASGALIESTAGPGRVGLELEFHLVDLADPGRRLEWQEVQATVAALPPMPAGSSVTLEPGGQIELSTPPADDLVRSVAALRADHAVLRAGLAARGLGAAPLGTDPARPSRRVNPHGRYVAMEQHFTALGCAAPGLAMMTATAALQVNLDAGPREQWPQRMGLIGALGPILVAASASSPLLGGRSSGWHSMRQEIWHGIDHSRSDPVAGPDPGEAWATYALDAPVLLVRDGESVLPVTRRVPFRAWLAGDGPVDRRPTRADLDYHLTTLFPPVRPRGWVEIRCLDALPDRWWPALAALTTVLVEDPIAADRAAEIAEPVAGSWLAAARDGLADHAIRVAVTDCVRLAHERAPHALRAELAAFGELVESGRTPSDLVRDRAERVGPVQLLREAAGD